MQLVCILNLGSFILTGNFATGWNANISSGHTFKQFVPISISCASLLLYHYKNLTCPLILCRAPEENTYLVRVVSEGSVGELVVSISVGMFVIIRCLLFKFPCI